MSRQFGKWHPTCPYCNQVYVLTNWMIRQRAGFNKAAWATENTHLLSCKARPLGLAEEQSDDS